MPDNDLTGQFLDSTFPDMIHFGNNGLGCPPSVPMPLLDGVSHALPLRVSQASAQVTGVFYEKANFAVAAGANSQAAATLLTAAINVITSAPGASRSVKLPAVTDTTDGVRTVTIVCTPRGININVYPQVGGQINGGGANNLYLLTAPSDQLITKTFRYMGGGNWVSDQASSSITLTGDVTGTGTGTVPALIANNAVTYGKMQAMNAGMLLGNATDSVGNMGEVMPSGDFLMDGGVLSLNKETGPLNIIDPEWGVVIGLDNTAAFRKILAAAATRSLLGNGSPVINLGSHLFKISNRCIFGGGYEIASIIGDGAYVTVTTVYPHGIQAGQTVYLTEIPAPNDALNAVRTCFDAPTPLTFRVPYGTPFGAVSLTAGVAEAEAYAGIKMIGDSSQTCIIQFTPASTNQPCFQVDHVTRSRFQGIFLMIEYGGTDGTGFLADRIHGSYNLYGTISDHVVWDDVEVYVNGARSGYGWFLGYKGGISEWEMHGCAAANCWYGIWADNQESIDGRHYSMSLSSCYEGVHNAQATNLQFHDFNTGGNINADFNFQYPGPYILDGGRIEATAMSGGIGVVVLGCPAAGGLTVTGCNFTPLGTIGVPCLVLGGQWTCTVNGSILGQNISLNTSNAGVAGGFSGTLTYNGVQIYDPVFVTNPASDRNVTLIYNGQFRIDSGSVFAGSLPNGVGLAIRPVSLSGIITVWGQQLPTPPYSTNPAPTFPAGVSIGSSGQFQVSAAGEVSINNILTLPLLTSQSMPFINSTHQVAEDNLNLNYNPASKRFSAGLNAVAKALVQSTPIVTSYTGSQTTAPFGVNTTPGNTILVEVWTCDGTGPSTVGDGVNTFVKDRDVGPTGGNNQRCQIWRSSGIVGGTTNAVTATIPGNAHCALSAAEFSGVLALVDAVSGTTGAPGTDPNTGALTTTNANDLIIAMYGCTTNTSAGSPPTGFTTIQDGTRNDGNSGGSWAYQFVNTIQTGTTYAWTGTGINGNNWAGLAVAYKTVTVHTALAAVHGNDLAAGTNAEFAVNSNGKPTKCNNDSLAGNGVPGIVKGVYLPNLGADPSAPFYTATAPGLFRVSITLQTTTAGAGSGTLSAAVQFDDDNGNSIVQFVKSDLTGAGISLDLTKLANFGGFDAGTHLVPCKSGSTIYLFITSGGAGYVNNPKYSVHATIERLI